MLRNQLIIEQKDNFVIKEFYIWRGPQQDQANKLHDRASRKLEDENLKLQLRYTFVNIYIKAVNVNRHCIYTFKKMLF